MLQDIATSKFRYVSRLSLLMRLDQGGGAVHLLFFLRSRGGQVNLPSLEGEGDTHHVLIYVWLILKPSPPDHYCRVPYLRWPTRDMLQIKKVAANL